MCARQSDHAGETMQKTVMLRIICEQLEFFLPYVLSMHVANMISWLILTICRSWASFDRGDLAINTPYLLPYGAQTVLVLLKFILESDCCLGEF
jgi:hypothetical protein